ncbi:MAG TPA: peptidyl-prolyl cis-trans isomerase [bacterium]|nr:peptidyl-prolyl cis-trans isomerase [bacterium]
MHERFSSRRLALFGCAVYLLLAAIETGCTSERPVAKPPRLVAQFGSGVITRDEFLSGFAKANYREARTYLEDMALQKVIMQEAKQSGISFTHAELADYVQELKKAYGLGQFDEYLAQSGLSYAEWLNQAKADLIRSNLIDTNVTEKIEVSDDELGEYYANHSSDFRVPRQVKARQILVQNDETAKQILRLLSRRKRSFESLAAEYSVAPEAAQGGDLGWVKRGDLPVELQTPIFELSEGEDSKVVHTSFGYHIFKVEKIKKSRIPPFDEVKDKVRAKVFAQKAKVRYDEWVKELKMKWRVKLFPEEIV